MHLHCSGPLPSRDHRRSWSPGSRCIVSLLVSAGLLGGGLLYGQAAAPNAKAGASSQPAATAPPAVDHTAEDTLDTAPPDELNDDGNPADQQQAPVIVVAPPLPNSGNVSAAPVLATVVPADAGGDARRQQINNECANLLMLANTLQAAVDKSTKDELSVSVVRKAGQIEQLARRVREEMRPVLSTQNSGAHP